MAENNNQIRVRLVTPDRVLVDDMATAVEICSTSGYIEVLYGHAPLLTELGVGHIRLHYSAKAEKDLFVVAGGFCEVLPDRVTILAAKSSPVEGLDVAAAEQQLARGKQMWSEAGDDAEKYEQANQVIHEAEATLAAGHGSKF